MTSNRNNNPTAGMWQPVDYHTTEEEIIKQLRTENAALKEQVAQQAEAIRLKDVVLEKIACIGNGDTHGNSIGNCLAIDALAIQPSPEILQARDERVAEACAKATDNEYPYTVFHTDQLAARNCGITIRSGEWRKYL